MKRWNGWGNINTSYQISPSALRYLEKMIGEGIRTPDATLAKVVSSVPDSRLPNLPKPSVRFAQNRHPQNLRVAESSRGSSLYSGHQRRSSRRGEWDGFG